MRTRTEYRESDTGRAERRTAETQVGAVGREVAVPVLWSILLASSYALTVSLVVLAVKVAFGLALDWWGIPLVGLAVWVATLTWRLTVCEADRREILLYPLETALGRDLDQDGYVGAPGAAVSDQAGMQPEPRVIYVNDYNRAQRTAHAQDFHFWLREVYNGRGATWRAWEGEALPSGRAIGRPLWQMWTGRLLRAGLADRAYPTAPLTLTGDYRAALESLREVL